MWRTRAGLVISVTALSALAGVSAAAALGLPLRERPAGDSLSLDGSDAYVSAADSRSLRLERTGAFTVALRVLLRSTTNNPLPRFWEKGPQYLCVMGDTTNARAGEIGLEVQNTALAGNANGGATEYWGSTHLKTGRWYVIAVTFDQSLRSNQAQIYVDGAREQMATVYPWSGTLFKTAGKPWMIGRRTNDLARQLNGLVDWMVVYPKVLTAAQIASLSTGNRPSGAAADWELDEGAGTTAHDSTSKRNDGSIVGGTFVAN